MSADNGSVKRWTKPATGRKLWREHDGTAKGWKRRPRWGHALFRQPIAIYREVLFSFHHDKLHVGCWHGWWGLELPCISPFLAIRSSCSYSINWEELISKSNTWRGFFSRYFFYFRSKLREPSVPINDVRPAQVNHWFSQALSRLGKSVMFGNRI